MIKLLILAIAAITIFFLGVFCGFFTLLFGMVISKLDAKEIKQ